MSIIGGEWRKGYPKARFDDIPENERCEKCQGKGMGMYRHRLIGGSEHIPCRYCLGTGRKDLEK